MKAHLRSVRIAPKKANLVAKMIRGLSVPDAMESLRLTNKKAARILENLLRSAIANASHNDRQDAQTMVVKTVVVNQGTAYRRGMPKARGQMRPYRKFLTHISLALGYPGMDSDETAMKSDKKASQVSKNAAKSPRTSTKKQTKSASQSDSDSSKASSAA